MNDKVAAFSLKKEKQKLMATQTRQQEYKKRHHDERKAKEVVAEMEMLCRRKGNKKWQIMI